MPSARDSSRGPRRRCRPSLAAATGAVLALTAACSGGGSFDSGADDAGKGTTLSIATSSDIITLDPAMYRSRPTQSVVRNVFDALVNQGSDLSIQPELATSWKEVNPTTWRFELRKGVKFQNGEPFNAEAVKFSIERVQNPAQKSPRASMLSSIDSVRMENPYAVVIKTKEPSPTLLAELAVNEIVPPAYVKKVGDKAFGRKPIGTGPFSFEEWAPNERTVLRANKNYWGGAPKVDRLVFRPIPEVSARIAALQSGDVSIASEVPPDLAKTLSGDVKPVTVAGTRVVFLAMNVTKAPFTSRGVREGANRAIDRRSLVTGLYQGHALALNQPAFPKMLGYDSGFQAYSFDQAQATRQLAEADNADVRIDTLEADKTLAEAVAGHLQKAGLNAKVNVLETGAFTESIEKGESQAYVSSWGVAEGDADVIFSTQFWSTTRKDTFYTGYRNAEVDKLIEQGRSSTDKAERTRIYNKAIAAVMKDAPWAPLVNPEEIYGVSAKVKNWQPSPIGRFNVVKTSLS